MAETETSVDAVLRPLDEAPDGDAVADRTAGPTAEATPIATTVSDDQSESAFEHAVEATVASATVSSRAPPSTFRPRAAEELLAPSEIASALGIDTNDADRWLRRLCDRHAGSTTRVGGRTRLTQAQ